MSSPATKAAGPAMEITIHKSDLLAELSATQSVTDRKSTVPILSNFLFETAGDKLLITATDLDLSLRTSCPAKIKTAGSCTIPARKLYEYVRLLQDGELTIKLLDNHWVQIRSGRSNTKMVGMARETFPALPLFPSDVRIPLPAQWLRTMIARTIFAISQEESRYTLNGALLVLKPEGMTMVATDGHRLALAETGNCKLPVSDETKILISKKALAEIGSLLNSAETEVVYLAKNESTLFFLIGKRLLTCRQLTGSFPNYEAVLPRDLDKTISVSGPTLSRALQRVSQFSDERSNSVRLQVAKDQLRISSSSAETGESEDLIETSYGGDPLMTGFNAHYLLDFMKVAGAGNVKFHFKAAGAPGEFHPADDDGQGKFRYIVMPMRA
jgi:DNA polymerase-3 subunit beta